MPQLYKSRSIFNRDNIFKTKDYQFLKDIFYQVITRLRCIILLTTLSGVEP